MLWDFPMSLTLDAMNRKSNIYRALVINPGSTVYLDRKRIYARNLEVPSGGAVCTARALARAYSAFATGGELGLLPKTLDLLAAPAVPSANGFYDECMKGEARFSLGFMKPCATWRFGGPRAFGAPGAGGAMGYADPDAGIGYGYVTSQSGTTLTGDPRDVALRSAMDEALARLPAAPGRLVA
jgi:CubicO group peptidase (beta-lactamase class C family)